MHEACSRGFYKIVKRLLKAGADPNAKGLENDTPLHDASSNDHVKVCSSSP
ncbi:MAG: ankyrin repeat domain-containing protein [bacterium]|nr:ankyrin repeat domain-containing protein [bacterium]